MVRIDWLAGCVALIAGVVGAYGVGCVIANGETDCTTYPDSAACHLGTGGGSSTGTMMSSSSTSGTGGGPPPPSCIPSGNVGAIDNTCGIFVSSSKGDDKTGKGTKEAPFKTLGVALTTAGKKPVYACGEAFKEAVTLKVNVELYGALDCAKNWAYDAAKKTTLTADPDAIPVTLTNMAGGSAIHDFAITAADAMKAGGSSIAVLDSGADVTLENVDVVAGNPVAGTKGMAQGQVMTPASALGMNGTDDATCNMTTNIPGGTGGTNTCGATMTNGGAGGKGAPVSTGDNGIAGSPMMTPGNGGSGQTGTASCNPGTKGTDGMAGTPGTGAHGIGDVSTSGYQAPAAAPGGAGAPGQGGGGGGAAKACDGSNMFAGPSGGGGGAGGCGGAPGSTGQSGGSSIGILALNAKLTLKTVKVTAKAGAPGGAGGDGQKGAAGGSPGHAPASSNACDGGKGGQGGVGGPGGGGAGGHSVGIAIKGGMLPDLSTTAITPAGGGAFGAGGDMDMTAQTKGDPGLGCKTLDFTTPMSPKACVM